MPRKTNTIKDPVLNPNPVVNDSVNDKVVINTNVNTNAVTNVNTNAAINVEPIVKQRKPRVSKKDKEVVTKEVTKEVVKEVVKEVTKEEVVKPKRGRKSKLELLTALNAATTPATSTNTVELIVVEKTSFNEGKNESKNESKNEGKNECNNEDKNEHVDLNVQDEDALDEDDEPTDKTDDNVKTTKKRGRKPKGGKIIQNFVANEAQKIDKPNQILHLKCSLKDLQQPSSCLVESYNFNSGNLNYDLLNKNEAMIKPSLSVANQGSVGINDIKGFNIMVNTNSTNKMNDLTKDSSKTNDLSMTKYRESDLDLSRNNYSNYNNNEYDDNYDDEDDEDYSDNKNCTKNVWRKLKQLEHNLHINNVNNKKSACFWCTCDFDNPPIYVPKHYINGTYHVYGCFCSPECGVAYLMNEAIDSSAKFERYHLLNHIYSKVYDYKKNIKPAPNPYYMLEKFYGNLSIQEYRSLLRNERLFLIVDKPLTRILPELHEDNDEFILNNKIIASNNYQLKSRMQKKKPSKGLSMNEKFGIGV